MKTIQNFPQITKKDFPLLSKNSKTKIKSMQITKKDEQISTYTKIDFDGPNGFLDQINKSLADDKSCLLYTSPSPRDGLLSRMPSSA